MKRFLLIPLLMTGLAGCASDGADAPPPDAEFVQSMIRKANGDPSKLSAEERKRMDEVTKGKTDEVIAVGARGQLPPPPPR